MFYLSKTFSLIIDIKILFGPPGLAEHRGTNQMQVTSTRLTSIGGGVSILNPSGYPSRLIAL